jgi:hypothetical protein
MQFIFTCSSGDIAFCPTEYLERIITRIRSEPDRTFLVQSKDPCTFNKVILPKNVILGTTLETNKDELCEGISKAPNPSQRYKDFFRVNHPLKMVTIEPVIDFDLDVMIDWVENTLCLRCIKPCGQNTKVEQKINGPVFEVGHESSSYRYVKTKHHLTT